MINKPVFTEKSFINAGKGTFTFLVEKTTNKNAVKVMIEDMFKVNVTKLTSMVRKGKIVKTGKRRLPSLSSPQKMVRVWLKKGQSIDLFDIKKD
ncbi:MAG: 50S ribosomal protein L23 [bacterium]